MTTVVTTASSGPYAAAADDTFAVTFQSISETEIAVYLDGVEISPSSWTFTRDDDGTGEVVLTAPVTGEVYIYSDPDYGQPSDFQRFGAFYPDQMNIPLDALSRQILALQRRIDTSMGSSDVLLREDLAATDGSTLVMFDHTETLLPGSVGGKLQRISVDPRDPPFNAAGDGVTNDLAAVTAAMTYAFANGLPVDGGDAIFAISGSLTFTGVTAPTVRNLSLLQLSPVNGRITLGFTTCQKVQAENIAIDIGSTGNVGDMNSTFGFYINGGAGHRVKNVDVTGDGKNSLIAIWNATDSIFDGLYAHDALFDSAAATDDVMQGIWFNVCTDVQVNDPKVSNLTGNALYVGVPFANLRTRGIIVSGCESVTITNPQVKNVEQSIDVTGSAGNRKVIIIGGRSYNCGSVGVKFANSAVYCKAIGHIAENTGFHGFLASGPAEAGLTFKTMDCEFIACTSINPGYNGITFADKSGFMLRVGDFDADYPKGIRFIGCTAIDNQTVKTMKYGYYNEGIAYDNVAKRPNQVIDCKSIGHTAAAEANFHRPICRVNSTAGDLAVSTATQTEVEWNNDSSPFEDSMAMHSPAVNPARITVPVNGIYLVRSEIVWKASNTTGYRRTSLLQNGTTKKIVASPPTSGEVTVNVVHEHLEMSAGDNVRINVEQTSGISVSIDRLNSKFHVELVREL